MISRRAGSVLLSCLLVASCGRGAPPTAVGGGPTIRLAASSEPLFDGLGAHRRSVTTASPEAQRYFDQGLAFLFAFNHDEAIRSFEEASRLDPGCAMAA